MNYFFIGPKFLKIPEPVIYIDNIPSLEYTPITTLNKYIKTNVISDDGLYFALWNKSNKLIDIDDFVPYTLSVSLIEKTLVTHSIFAGFQNIFSNLPKETPDFSAFIDSIHKNTFI
jgi:hypothetical protein